MRTFILGIIVGSLLPASLVMAGNFYNSKGEPAAPRGSIQQFDYFRQRQLLLDQSAIRRAQEESLRNQKLNPCGR